MGLSITYAEGLNTISGKKRSHSYILTTEESGQDLDNRLFWSSTYDWHFKTELLLLVCDGHLTTIGVVLAAPDQGMTLSLQRWGAT